jgi:membrane protein YqaA with SNARE-associated domain
MAPGVLATGVVDYQQLTFLPNDHRMRGLYPGAVCYLRAGRQFHMMPWVSIFIAALTPILFFPFKFLSVADSYPEKRYLSALFLGRFPRYLIFTSGGRALGIPN